MMDTILNLGLNEEVVEVMEKNPVIRAGLTTVTEDLSRCILTVVRKSGKKYFDDSLTK